MSMGSVPRDPGDGVVPEERRWLFLERVGETGSVTGGESQDGAGAGRGAAGPVSKERRQEKRVKWSRKTAACLRMCSLDTLQSA